MKEIQQLACENGASIEINLREEPDIARDKYQSINRRDEGKKFSAHANPLNYSPSFYDLQRAGLKENSRVIAVVPHQDFINNDAGFNDIEIKRSTVQTATGRYEIVDKSLTGQYGDTYLYINLGLSKL